MELLADKLQSFKNELAERMQQVEQRVEHFSFRITRLESVGQEENSCTENDELNIINSEEVS